jgi:NADPH:quinone reductase-like Zn-dependent oxidoreductase
MYTTVGSLEKRALLHDEYGLRKDQIFRSRDTSFIAGTKRATDNPTDNRGVDCVLNSLAGELLRQTVYCLAPFGTFVEIGMRDVLGNTRLDMLPVAKQTTFTPINLWEIIARRRSSWVASSARRLPVWADADREASREARVLI